MKLTVGDPVILRRAGKFGGIALVKALVYKPEGGTPRLCRQVRWVNIRKRRAIALLVDGRKVWGEGIDPIYRD